MTANQTRRRSSLHSGWNAHPDTCNYGQDVPIVVTHNFRVIRVCAEHCPRINATEYVSLFYFDIVENTRKFIVPQFHSDTQIHLGTNAAQFSNNNNTNCKQIVIFFLYFYYYNKQHFERT